MLARSKSCSQDVESDGATYSRSGGHCSSRLLLKVLRGDSHVGVDVLLGSRSIFKSGLIRPKILSWFDSPSTGSPTLSLFSHQHFILSLCLSPLSPFFWISLYFSHSLLSFSLPLPVTPLPLLSLPHLWEAAVVRMSQMSQFVEAVCTRTHTHIYILSPTKASVSVCLSVRCSTNRRERGRQIESERQKRGGRDKKREKKDKAENREVKREKERQVQSRENLKRRGCCCCCCCCSASLLDFWRVWARTWQTCSIQVSDSDRAGSCVCEAMASAQPGVHALKLQPPTVSHTLRIGSNFIKWDEVNSQYTMLSMSEYNPYYYSVHSLQLSWRERKRRRERRKCAMLSDVFTVHVLTGHWH